MTDPRKKLLDRFRATLLDRIRIALQALGGAADGDPSQQALVRRELHTFKGETRMLGLSAQSHLAHVLETCVDGLFGGSGEAGSKPRESIESAMRLLERSLGDDVPEQVEQELAAAAVSLDVDEEAHTEELLAPAELRGPSAAPLAEGQPVSEAPARDSMSPSGGRGEPQPAEALRPSRGRWVQVEAALIDTLCARIAELSAVFRTVHARAAADRDGARNEDEKQALAERVEELNGVRGLLDECTEDAWALRLTPVQPTLEELAAHARRLAKQAGQSVAVEVDSAGVHLESDVLDQLWDSLLHLVQNALEHGLEAPADRAPKDSTGRLTIRAESHGPSVVFEVEDDGRGIRVDDVLSVAIERGALPRDTRHLDSTALLALLCSQGFSTRRAVGHLSGRGIGLDVVQSKVEALGGSLHVETDVGRGTRFRMQVPFAVTRERLLVLSAGDMKLALPARLARAVARLGPEDGASRVLRHDGAVVPLRSLGALLELEPQPEPTAVILDVGGRLWALSVPDVLGERELIRTPADPLLVTTSLFGATASLDDGALVLVPQLDRFARLLSTTGPGVSAQSRSRSRRPVVLVVDDSPIVRDLIAETLSVAGLDVVTASDGAEGIETVESADPDLVLSDVEMPRVDGFELLTRIRRRSQGLPVIMLTTRGSLEDKKRATALGANAYLTKTEFRTGTLLDTVSRFIELPS